MMAITRFSRRFGWNPGPIFFSRSTICLDANALSGDGWVTFLIHRSGAIFMPSESTSCKHGLTETSAAAFVPPMETTSLALWAPLAGVEERLSIRSRRKKVASRLVKSQFVEPS
jgi:hypothetical protein